MAIESSVFELLMTVAEEVGLEGANSLDPAPADFRALGLRRRSRPA